MLTEEWLKDQGRNVVMLREPGGTKAGDMIRSILLSDDTGDLDPMTELLLFSAARRELLATVIAPALEEGKVILCDRFFDSTLAYQGYGRGVDHLFIEMVSNFICGDTTPTKTIFLDLPVEEGLKRANARLSIDGSSEGRFEKETLDFHHRVREGFLAIAKQEPERVKTIGASGTVEEVFAQIKNAIKGIL